MATSGIDPQAQPPGRLGQAVLAGIGAAVAGALVWGLIAYLTKHQFSLMALLIGFAVGTVVVRVAGGARSPGLGAICAVLAVFGCALGSLVAEILVLLGHGVPASVIMANLNLVLREYPSAVGGLGFVFWLLGAFYGYRIAMGAPAWGRRAARPGLPQGDSQQYGQWPQAGGTAPGPADSQPAAGTTPAGPAGSQQYGQWPQADGTAPAEPPAGQRLFFGPPPESLAAGADPAGPGPADGADPAASDLAAGADPAGPEPAGPSPAGTDPAAADLAAGADPAGPPPSAPAG
jgi:hypothetical protein